MKHFPDGCVEESKEFARGGVRWPSFSRYCFSPSSFCLAWNSIAISKKRLIKEIQNERNQTEEKIRPSMIIAGVLVLALLATTPFVVEQIEPDKLVSFIPRQAVSKMRRYRKAGMSFHQSHG